MANLEKEVFYLCKKYFNLRTMIVLALLAAIGAVLKAYMPGRLFFG